MPHILLADDDPGIRDLISEFLIQQGYQVTTAADGVRLDQALASASPPVDLVILDLMMPGEHGLDIARRLAVGNGPAIIILSAIGDDSDRIVGLELGADDYLSKPCNPRELLARVRAVLRRRGNSTAEASVQVTFAGWTLDLVRHELTSPDAVLISLSDKEFALLRSFVERPQQVLTREELLEAVYGKNRNEQFDRSIDVQISRLRRKLESAGQQAEPLIRTVRHEGYCFTPQVVSN